MTTLTHRAARHAAQQAADGRLDAEAQAALDAHLRGCPACRAYAADLAAVEHALRDSLASRWDAAAARGPAPDLARRLTRPGGPSPMRTNRLDLIGRAAGALAVVVLVLALVFTLQLQPEPVVPAAGGTEEQGLPGTPDLGTPTPLPPPTRHFEPLPTTYSVQADFPGVGTLTGYAIGPIGDNTLNIYTVWHAAAVPIQDYVLSIQLEDGAGQLRAQSDSSPAAHRPTSEWLAGEYAEVALWLVLPPDLPAGDYTLYALAYDRQTGQRVPPASGDLGAGDRVRLGTLQLLLNATITPTPMDWAPPGADCAAVACTPTPVFCYGYCPGSVFNVTVPPCDPAVSVCPEASGTALAFPTFTPCLIGCPDAAATATHPPSPEPTATPLPPATAIAFYTVQPGDTCQSIAAAYGTTVEVLLALNNPLDCANLVPGQVLLFPLGLTATPPPPPTAQPVTYTVQAGDTCQGIADSFGLPLDVLLAANGLTDCLSISVGQVLVIPLTPSASATPCQLGCPETPTPAPTPPPRPT
jgi:LysM repeat protein